MTPGSLTAVITGETSDPHARSPLCAPGNRRALLVMLVAVDGRSVGLAGPGALLVGTAGKPAGTDRAPRWWWRTASGRDGLSLTEEPLRYHDWVANRRAFTHLLIQWPGVTCTCART